ncbi:MAG: hypothetical protein WD266_04050 [Balneolales bacterium]
MRNIFQRSLVIPILVLLAGCSAEEPATLADTIQHLNMENRYEEALEILREADQDENTIMQLQIATHMNYALYLTHESDQQMTERMPAALRHFRRVLELDPGNERARAEADQIESIYRSLGRDIPEGVAS